MYILGLNGSPSLVDENRLGVEESIYHDAAAALLHDGNIVAAIEEERLNRIKHTNKLPVLAANACLKYCSVPFEEVDCFSLSTSQESLDHMLSGYFANAGVAYPGARYFIQRLLEDQFQTNIGIDKIELFEHHYVHAVTAFYPSRFDSALVLTIDGSGGEYSGSVYEGKGNELTGLKTFSVEQSLGHFYLYVTYLLGFRLFDEYKVMGLAPYGNPRIYQKMFEDFYRLLPDGNYELFTQRTSKLKEIIPSKSFGFSQIHMDVAAALQDTLEKIVFHVVRHYKSLTGHSRLCLAGGVALNCTLNGKLINSHLFEDVFVYPGANDSGMPVGSALAAYFKRSERPRRKLLNKMYLGKEVGSPDDIERELGHWAQLISYEKVENICHKAASLLAEDKVLGWVQGRSEFAPRALGNRSIIADARPAKNKDRINFMVKKREGFRPFAPSVLEEDVAEYFEVPEGRTEFAHMTFVLAVREKYRQHLGAITHVDGTARVQTVSKEDNSRYWELINHFKDMTGTPVILNTSFNNNAEPIVDSVSDAVVSFLTTQLDNLVIGDFLVTKSGFTMESLTGLYGSLPPCIKLRRKEKRFSLPGSHAEIKYELSNTFNEKTVDIPEGLLELLTELNGKKSFGAIMTGKNINGAAEREKLLKLVYELWVKRVVILSPMPL